MPALVAEHIVAATKSTIQDFEDKIIADEEPMTDRLFGVISASLNGTEIGGLVWKARTLRTGRGVAAEEKRHGADVLGVLSIDLPEYRTTKGFLLQAKVMEPGKPISSDEWKRFQGQCRTMLGRTCDAFAVIYSRKAGIRFMKAAAILEMDRAAIFAMGYRTLFGFFKDHVKCEIGDRRLNYPSIETLDRIGGSKAVPTLDVPDARVIALKVTNA